MTDALDDIFKEDKPPRTGQDLKYIACEGITLYAGPDRIGKTIIEAPHSYRPPSIDYDSKRCPQHDEQFAKYITWGWVTKDAI